FKFLLNLDLFDEIEIGLLADRHINLLEGILPFRDPDCSCERQVLSASREKVEPVTEFVTHVNTVRKIILIIQPPSVRDRRHKIFRDDIEPVLIEIVLLKR